MKFHMFLATSMMVTIHNSNQANTLFGSDKMSINSSIDEENAVMSTKKL